jgi:hypothetical protein
VIYSPTKDRIAGMLWIPWWTATWPPAA